MHQVFALLLIQFGLLSWGGVDLAAVELLLHVNLSLLLFSFEFINRESHGVFHLEVLEFGVEFLGESVIEQLCITIGCFAQQVEQQFLNALVFAE